jgi:hypothetical protein
MPTRRKSRHTPHSHVQHSTPKQGLKKPQWKNSFCTRNPQHPASRQASKNPLSFFCFPDPIAQTKASKRQWKASTLKGKHQPKKDYPDGISPCAKRTVYFLQI